MADSDFERRLERLFGQAPELPDQLAFAAGVERRLNRGWTLRRWLIGAAGLVGGVIGASQLMVSSLFERVEATEVAVRAIGAGFGRATSGARMLTALSSDLGVWIAAGLAVLTMLFVLTRVIEEL